ncbi:polysaccharide biosynthesis/export family protein [Pleomorphovibrio marinus]|uniref:polysaccharide biosynthesis/export family protein n=1 Tax=Pleomorphovibrio marinus TaxID=2164132 RepID=UPI000E0C05E2|nr:polysaccharide biosynthesis/export family protein [Pleomorphovibrio marinus]
MRATLVLTVVIGLQLFSCVPNKQLIYLQNLEGNEPILDDSLINYNHSDEYRIQVNDVIDIQIHTTDLEMNEMFNIRPLMTMQTQQMAAASGGDVFYITGHTVDINGRVDLPLLGEIQVASKTLKEIKAEISTELKKFITNDDFYVRARLGGVRFSAIGEFQKPGKYVVLQDRLTILEAVAHAGDLKIAAKRDEIILIRQYPEGTRIHRVNLNDRNLIKTPYYFIRPNDQIYAEPLRIRELGAGENVAQSLQLIITSVTAAALILNLIIN